MSTRLAGALCAVYSVFLLITAIASMLYLHVASALLVVLGVSLCIPLVARIAPAVARRRRGWVVLAAVPAVLLFLCVLGVAGHLACEAAMAGPQGQLAGLFFKSLQAASDKGVSTLSVSGGVSANRRLRGAFTEACATEGLQVFFPPLALCGDNAAMIAAAGHARLTRGESSGLDLDAIPNAPVDL